MIPVIRIIVINLVLTGTVIAKNINLLNTSNTMKEIYSRPARQIELDYGDPILDPVGESLNIETKPKKLPPWIKYEPFETPKNYNKFQVPSLGYVVALANMFSDEEHVEIFDLMGFSTSVKVRIHDVADVNEINEDITFSADLILEWNDAVISAAGLRKYNISVDDELQGTDLLFKTLDQAFLEKIWIPDLFIEGLIKVTRPEIMMKPVTLRINEVTGEIVYITRLLVRMQCAMDYHYYPADTQTCNILLRSHSYSTNELTLEWAEPFGVILEDCRGPNFDFKVTGVNSDTFEKPSIGNKTRDFSRLQFQVVARRKLSYHMVQTYLPSVFFIIITWLCFLVPASMVEARIGIAMTTLLTLTAMFASVRESSPAVSYVKAIDVWMVACIFFVFITLLEFTILLWLRTGGENKGGKEDTNDSQTSTAAEQRRHSRISTVECWRNSHVVIYIGNNYSEAAGMKPTAWSKLSASGLIEKFAFILFFALFAVFNLVYWAWLLIDSNYFDWEVDPDYNNCN